MRTRQREERDSEFVDKLVHINRVAKVVKGGTPFRLRRARHRRRPEGPGRFRPRQGARSAGSDPQGDRFRQAQPDPRAAARRPHAASRRARPPRRRQGFPARGASGNRHHRRRPDARRVRDARHAGRGGEVARLVQPLQHGARDFRRAEAPGFAALGRGAPQHQGFCSAVTPRAASEWRRRRRASGVPTWPSPPRQSR